MSCLGKRDAPEEPDQPEKAPTEAEDPYKTEDEEYEPEQPKEPEKPKTWVDAFRIQDAHIDRQRASMINIRKQVFPSHQADVLADKIAEQRDQQQLIMFALDALIIKDSK